MVNAASHTASSMTTVLYLLISASLNYRIQLQLNRRGTLGTTAGLEAVSDDAEADSGFRSRMLKMPSVEIDHGTLPDLRLV
ncbi:putative electron transfer flavoprotein subunit [Apiospora arundinis]